MQLRRCGSTFEADFIIFKSTHLFLKNCWIL